MQMQHASCIAEQLFASVCWADIMACTLQKRLLRCFFKAEDFLAYSRLRGMQLLCGDREAPAINNSHKSTQEIETEYVIHNLNEYQLNI
ncbi:hypothetical protein D9M69_649640 [compost metagenome]